MEKQTLLYEGKAKKVYTTEDERYYIVSYKDDATAFNGEKKGTILGKGVVNNRMSNIMCRMLEENALGDPMINDYHILALGIATPEELQIMSEMTFKINALLKEYFDKIGVKLIDFKIELGRVDGKIILADEISPDTCRFWDKETNKKLDKDRFRRDMGGVEEVYAEMLNRVTK